MAGNTGHKVVDRGLLSEYCDLRKATNSKSRPAGIKEDEQTSTLVDGIPVDCNLKNAVAEFVVLWGRWLLCGHEERQAQPITRRTMSEFAVEEHERKERAPGENFSTGSRDHVAEES